jgi:hypothetical protein
VTSDAPEELRPILDSTLRRFAFENAGPQLYRRVREEIEAALKGMKLSQQFEVVVDNSEEDTAMHKLNVRIVERSAVDRLSDLVSADED